MNLIIVFFLLFPSHLYVTFIIYVANPRTHCTLTVLLKIVNGLLKKMGGYIIYLPMCLLFLKFFISFCGILNFCFHLVLMNFPSLKTSLRLGMIES